MRYGAVCYLNARPLVEGPPPLVLDTPAGLVRRCERGELDVALLPVVAGERAGLSRVGSLGVAADGPVESVLLFLRAEPQAIETLALDPDSRTSALLAQLLLRARHGRRPQIVDPGNGADAELVIGDRALLRGAGGEPRLDLAHAWREWTDLPFVFAAWYGDPAAEDELARAYERGRTRLRQYVAESGLALETGTLERYLRDRIRYRLAGRELGGLARFLDEARRLSLL